MSNRTPQKARKAAIRLDTELVQRSDDFEVCNAGAAKRLLLDILEWLRPDQASSKRPGELTSSSLLKWEMDRG